MNKNKTGKGFRPTFNYIIRKKSEVVSEDFLTIAEMIMHSNDTNLHHIFEYFILHMRNHLKD